MVVDQEEVQPVALPQTVTIARQRTINISKIVITSKDIRNHIILINQIRVLKALNVLKGNFKNSVVNLTKWLHFYYLSDSFSIHLLLYKTAKYTPIVISTKVERTLKNELITFKKVK